MSALPSSLLAGPAPDLSRLGHHARSLRWFAREARRLIEARPCPACSARLLLLDDAGETAAVDGDLIDALLAADLNLSIGAMTDGITRAAAGVAVAAPHAPGCPRHRPAAGEGGVMDALTTVEAAARLGISHQALTKAIRAGRLAAEGGPYRRRIDVTAVAAYAAERARRAAGGACPVCGRPVPGRAAGSPGVYCSKRCGTAALYRARRGMAVDGSGQTTVCAHCGETFRRRSIARRYCSGRCRQRAFWARRGQETTR